MSTKQKIVAGKNRDNMNCKGHILSNKIQFEVKLNLDET